MHKMLIMVGASALAFGVLSDSAEARKRYYEINGQRYSYETRDPAQVAIARKRIEAANALDAAKAKAEAERAQAPLSAAFGSSVQQEAKQAEARLQQALADGQSTEAVRPSRNRRSATDERRSTRSAEKASGPPAIEQAALHKQIAPSPPKPVAAVAERLQLHARKKVRSVSFDMETGIKTVIMVDGSAEEEPFDSSVLSKLVPEDKSNSLTAFVNQLRKVLPEDATGSISRTLLPLPTSEAAAHP